MIALFYTCLPEDKRLHRAAARKLLAYGVSQCWPCLSPLPEIEISSLGKPFFPSWPNCHFNLSHSGSWAICALSDRPVGVDLQISRPLRSRVSRNFTQEEQAYLDTQPPEVFFDLWVKKEAYLKAKGVGLTERLSSFPVLPLPENCPASGFIDRLLPCPIPGYHLAVCGQISPLEELTPILWKGTSL